MEVLELCESERGNTLLIDDGNMVCIVRLADEQWLQVTWLPENYPSFDIYSFQARREELKTHLQERFSGWYASKNNIELMLCPDGFVIDPKDGEEDAG